VLVGHSQGANNVIDMVRMLEAQNVPIALLVTLSPYMQNPIPSNVVRGTSYHQSSGWDAPIAAAPGFRGELMNVDLSSDPTLAHINIDKSVTVQAEITHKIIGVVKAN
jgi:predicted esterase